MRHRATAPPPQLIERDDHLVGSDETKLLSNQLISHVRVGLVRVEQLGTVLQFGALLFDFAQLRLPLKQGAMIAAPRKNAVGAGNRMAGERADDDHRQGRHGDPANERENAVRSPNHDVRRITSESQTQAKIMIWSNERG